MSAPGTDEKKYPPEVASKQIKHSNKTKTGINSNNDNYFVFVLTFGVNWPVKFSNQKHDITGWHMKCQLSLITLFRAQALILLYTRIVQLRCTGLVMSII